jgi:hypothetical protein
MSKLQGCTDNAQLLGPHDDSPAAARQAIDDDTRSAQAIPIDDTIASWEYEGACQRMWPDTYV